MPGGEFQHLRGNFLGIVRQAIEVLDLRSPGQQFYWLGNIIPDIFIFYSGRIKPIAYLAGQFLYRFFRGVEVHGMVQFMRYARPVSLVHEEVRPVIQRNYPGIPLCSFRECGRRPHQPLLDIIQPFHNTLVAHGAGRALRFLVDDFYHPSGRFHVVLVYIVEVEYPVVYSGESFSKSFQFPLCFGAVLAGPLLVSPVT